MLQRHPGRACLVLLLAWWALLAGALAQPGADAGDQQIVQALYGTAQRHVDVTQRLKELARQDRRFLLGNDSFGVDPHVNHVKTLRVFARGPDGQVRTFEYAEGSWVDGARFSGWGRGDWGQAGWRGGWDGADVQTTRRHDEGGYQILSARYGTATRHIDVTDRLRELARSDRSFRAGNNSLGFDPHPNQVKTLRIVARGPDGRERTFQYAEGSLVDGALFVGWSSGDWGQRRGLVILSASYGAGALRRDVTGELRSRVRDARLQTRVANDTLGGIDPAPQQRKTLVVSYSVDGGRPKQLQVDEDAWLKLP